MPVYQDKDKNGKIIKAKDEEAVFLLKRDIPYNKPFNLVAKDYFENLERIRKTSTHTTYSKDYNSQIKGFFKDMNISSINVQTIRELAENLEKKGLSVKHMNKIKNVLDNIFNFAMKNYNLDNNPSKVYGRFQEKHEKVVSDEEKLKYITLEEFNTFISYIDDIMWKTFFTFAYYTGCRKGEIQTLTWNDINFETDEIRIIKTLTVKCKEIYKITNVKNKEKRRIKMNNVLHNVLIKYKTIVSQYTGFTDNWYIFGNDCFLSQSTIERKKDTYFRISNVKRITMHEFRHSHVSLLINEYVKASKEKNMKIDTAKFCLMMADRMGHTIQVMQDTYMHLFPTVQDEIVDLLNNL